MSAFYGWGFAQQKTLSHLVAGADAQLVEDGQVDGGRRPHDDGVGRDLGSISWIIKVRNVST
jgi:hypothetical protein